MSSRTPHWNWLASFAICNLLFWIAVAVVVGVLASNKVDLGIESFLRTRQATVVAIWGRTTSEPVESPARPPAADQTARPTHTTAPTTRPTVQPARPGRAARTPAPSSPIRPTTPAGPTGRPAQPTAQPTETAIHSPLLVSDPDMNGLARIDAEMARSAVGRPVQIRYDEAALNREVSALLASYPNLPYQDLHIDLKRGGVILTGRVTVLGVRVKAEIRGKVVASNCLPQAEIDTVSIAGLATPAFVREGIQEIIAESLSWYPADYPLCLEQIVLEEDRVTIYGSRR